MEETQYIQIGEGIGETALKFIKDHKQDIIDAGAFVYNNPKLVFQYTSNGQRFVSKNIIGNKRPIRYLKLGELHLKNHNFTGPGTRVDLAEVANHAPYNDIDACSKIHDLEYERIFKMPKGREREQAIRDADIESIKCYNKHRGEHGYRLASTGINSKMLFENVDPSTFEDLLSDDYKGAERGISTIKDDKPQKPQIPSGQRGGFFDPISVATYGTAAIIPVIAAGYGEYRLGKYIYQRAFEP